VRAPLSVGGVVTIAPDTSEAYILVTAGGSRSVQATGLAASFVDLPGPGGGALLCVAGASTLLRRRR
jgi:hypothetical protein